MREERRSALPALPFRVAPLNAAWLADSLCVGSATVNAGVATEAETRPPEQAGSGEDVEPFVLLVDTFKGGTGKTTTARWLAARLSVKGVRVLLAGLSPQNDLVIESSTSVRGVRDVFAGGGEPSLTTLTDHLWYAPAGIAAFPKVDPGLGSYYRTLGRNLGCSWVVVDGLNFLGDAAWWVLDEANGLLVPSMPSPEAVRAGLRTVRAVVRAQSTLERAQRLSLLRMLLVDVPAPSRMSAATRELLAALEEAYDSVLCSSRIRHTERRQARDDDSGLLGAGLRTDLSGPRISEDYDSLVDELLTSVRRGQPPSPNGRGFRGGVGR